MNSRKNQDANVPFQVLGTTFGAFLETASNLYFSTDGFNYVKYEEEIPAGNLFVNGCVSGMYCKFDQDATILF